MDLVCPEFTLLVHLSILAGGHQWTGSEAQQLSLEACQDCEGSEFLLYWQAHKLAWHSFLEAGMRYNTPSLETKEFIKHGGEVPLACKGHGHEASKSGWMMDAVHRVGV